LLQHAQLVVGVENREVGLKAGELGVAPEHPRGDRVKGPQRRHALDRAAADRRHALLHLAGCLVGEGDGQNLARPCLSGGDQMRQARRQRRGLSGAGAGEHQHRPFGRQHRLALRRVQALQVCGIAGRRRRFRHLAEVGQGERIGNRIARLFDAPAQLLFGGDEQAGISPGRRVRVRAAFR
jgi:hypothetical protein